MKPTNNPQSQDPPEANNAAPAGCMARLVSHPIDRHQDGMPSYECLIEIWVDGDWLECEWHPRTEGFKADDGYLGTARTTSRPIQIGFHAWQQNDSEFRDYKIVANAELSHRP